MESKKQRICLGAWAFFLVWVISCDKGAVEQEDTPQEERSIPVRVQVLEGENFVEYGEFLGQIRGINQAPLISYAGGRVLKISGKEGQRVKAGDRLCDIEGASHDVQWKSAKLASRIADSTLKRRKTAVERGAASRLQLDQAQGEVLASQKRVLDAKKIRDGAFCISPIGGTIVERLIRDFQVLPQGSQTFVVADLSKLVIQFGIPENEIQGYKVGSPVRVSLSAYPGKTWEGAISSLAQSVNEKGRTFLAEAEIANEGGILKPGLTARLKVERFSFQDQVVIPQSSILTSGKEQFVYIVEGNQARKRAVSVLAANKQRSVIRSGLKKGQKLIIAGQLLAGDGAPVRELKNEGTVDP